MIDTGTLSFGSVGTFGQKAGTAVPVVIALLWAWEDDETMLWEDSTTLQVEDEA